MKKVFAVAFCLFIIYTSCAQSIAINTDGSQPNTSAILDIKNANKGLLIPRVNLVSETDATTIPSPVVSLLIYNTNAALPDGAGFYFWNANGKWSKLATVNSLNNVSWGVSGNNATDPNTNFIGTSDNQPLVFKTNNILSGKIAPGPNNVFFGQYAGASQTTGTNNTFLGHQAGETNTTGSNNLFVGHASGNKNTSGIDNVFIGQDAGKANTIGDRNVFAGEDAGIANTTGDDNIYVGNGAGRLSATPYQQVAIGSEALSADITGHSNVAVGYYSLKGTTSGNANAAFGHSALISNTSGIGNVANGFQALYTNNAGHENVATGYKAAYANTSGDYNVAIGFNALNTNTTGSNNIAIGHDADVSSSNLSNATAIGNNATVSTSNTMAFGDATVKHWVFGKSTVTPPYLNNPVHALEVGTNGTNGNGAYLTTGGAWTNTSSRIKKEGFSELNGNDLLQKIAQLPVQKWKYKGSEEYHIGPVAEDFYALFGLGTDDKGISTVDPSGIALAAIKELTIQNEEMKQMIKNQNEQIVQLRLAIESIVKK